MTPVGGTDGTEETISRSKRWAENAQKATGELPTGMSEAEKREVENLDASPLFTLTEKIFGVVLILLILGGIGYWFFR